MVEITKSNIEADPKKIALNKGEKMTCTINPHHSFPNDAMSCIFTEDKGSESRSELYLRKKQSVIIENSGDLQLDILEYARERTISRFSIKRI